VNLPGYALTHRVVLLTLLSVFVAAGLFNFSTMSRREDPEITIRDALIITQWHGASATRIDDLITYPIEKAIAQIAEIDVIETKSFAGISIIQVTTNDTVQDTDQIWDDLRAKVETVRHILPPGADPPFVDSDFGDVYEIVFALYQEPMDSEASVAHRYSPRELEVFAERIEDELRLIGAVGKIDLWGVQAERIYIEIDSADWARLKLTPQELKSVFQSRNIIEPGGQFDTRQTRYSIDTSGQFSTLSQIEDLIVDRRYGRLPVRLGDLPISVDRRYQEPPAALTRVTTPDLGARDCLVLGISMKSGNNVVELSQSVDTSLAGLYNSVLPPDLKIIRVNDLPRQVETRITNFQFSLLQGIFIVLGVALLTMGWRPALIMATAIPLSMISAFAVVQSLGVDLEQFSIASLLISLGMVVDSAIVVSDNTYRLMREGVPRREAVIQGANRLAAPLFLSTLTTIFAFLPMLTIKGNVGEYVSSLPVVVSMTLVASYAVAMLITPLMCWWLLHPSDKTEPSPSPMRQMLSWYERLIAICLNNKHTVLGVTLLLLIGSFALIPGIGSQFFPAGSRDQFTIKVWLPEGSSIQATSKVVANLESIIEQASSVVIGGKVLQRLKNAIAYIGTGGPRIMLTQEPEYDQPFFAQILVNTSDAEFTDGFVHDIREQMASIYDARITVDKFMLGPPIKDPIAFRLSGPDPDVLRQAGRDMVKLLAQTTGIEDPYSNWGSPAFSVDIKVDPYAASLAGVTHSDITNATRTLLSGMVLTTYREGDHQIPIVLRTLREKRSQIGDLSGIYVDGKFGKVPLNSVADIETSWQPAVIAKRNKHYTVTIGARLEPGMLANRLTSKALPALRRFVSGLPPGYFLEQGGEQEETHKAQLQVLRAVAIAILLMTLTLIIYYNSLVKSLVILATVPLASIGVFIGLWTTGWPMGFMAMLGALSLAGIVINNAIVLIDFIERALAKGVPLHEAIVSAGRIRARPIVLTTLTTIGGLLPLSFFGGPLWAPMTNSMIFGLAVSTVLTMFVVPSLYALFAERCNVPTNNPLRLD